MVSGEPNKDVPLAIVLSPKQSHFNNLNNEVVSLPGNLCIRLQPCKSHTTIVNLLFPNPDPLVLFKAISSYLNTIFSILSQYQVNIKSSVNRSTIG